MTNEQQLTFKNLRGVTPLLWIKARTVPSTRESGSYFLGLTVGFTDGDDLVYADVTKDVGTQAAPRLPWVREWSDPDPKGIRHAKVDLGLQYSLEGAAYAPVAMMEGKAGVFTSAKLSFDRLAWAVRPHLDIGLDVEAEDAALANEADAGF